MEGLLRPPSAGGAGAARATGRLQPAGGDSSAKFARRPSLPENLAARARTRRGTAHRPAPRLGRPPARRGRPAAKRSRALGPWAEEKVALPSSAARGPLAAACTRVQAGGLNPCEGAGLPEGLTRGAGERHPQNPRGTKSVPRPESNFADSHPRRGTPGQVPPRPGPAACFRRKFPAPG